jgi:hypothetical protein
MLLLIKDLVQGNCPPESREIGGIFGFGSKVTSRQFLRITSCYLYHSRRATAQN